MTSAAQTIATRLTEIQADLRALIGPLYGICKAPQGGRMLRESMRYAVELLEAVKTEVSKY